MLAAAPTKELQLIVEVIAGAIHAVWSRLDVVGRIAIGILDSEAVGLIEPLGHLEQVTALDAPLDEVSLKVTLAEKGRTLPLDVEPDGIAEDAHLLNSTARDAPGGTERIEQLIASRNHEKPDVVVDKRKTPAALQSG